MDMDINIIFKVGAIGILVAVFNQILTRTGRDEQAMFITLAGVIVVMALIINMMNELFMEVKAIFNLY
jgi:stage III sporulation protein AC